MIVIIKIAVMFFCVVSALCIIGAIIWYIVMCCIGFPKDYTYQETMHLNLNNNKEEKINYLNAI